MIKDIDHVAVKVSDIDSVCSAFTGLGYECSSVGQYDEVGMKIAFLGKGDSRMELLEVTDSSSPAAEDKNGMHHIGVKVDNIEAVFSKMKGDNRYIVEGQVRQGAHSRIFFFRLNGEEETLYECVEA